MALEGTWDELVKNLAKELAYYLKKEMYRAHYQRLKTQKTASEKLVYLHILHSQPQTFTSIQRSLGLSSYTVNQALRRLRDHGHVVKDSRLYWVSDPETER